MHTVNRILLPTSHMFAFPATEPSFVSERGECRNAELRQLHYVRSVCPLHDLGFNHIRQPTVSERRSRQLKAKVLFIDAVDRKELIGWQTGAR